MKIWQQAVASAAALTSVLVAAAGPDPGTGEQPMVVTSVAGGDAVRLVLRGQLTGLHPGAVRQLRVSLVNDSAATVTLRSLDGWVAGSSRHQECRPQGNLRILGYRGRLPVTVRPHHRLDLAGAMPVEMPTAAPPQCAGSRFSIVVSGTGTRSRR